MTDVSQAESGGDPIGRTAIALAKDLESKALGCREVVEAHIRHIEARDPVVGAVVTRDFDRALDRADAADAALGRGERWGPLHGVPITVKDTYDTEGLRTTIGLPWLMNNVPLRNATLVTRLVEAGAILLGKTNLPFSSYDWQCVHPKLGRTSNPHHLGHTCGGSSGGSAASIAAGFSALELGSDVAGSIRVPAAFCGVFGLRPTEGLLSTAGHGHVPNTPHSLRSFVCCGPLARSARDLSLALELLSEVDEDDWGAAPRSAMLGVASDLAGCRFGFTESLVGIQATEDTRRALARIVRGLVDAGAHVEEMTPPADLHEGMRVWGGVHGPELRAAFPLPFRIPPFSQLVRPAMRLRFGGGEWARALRRGFTGGVHAYFAARTARDAYVARAERELANVDAWICPVGARPAFQHARTGSLLDVDGQPVPYGDVVGMYNCPIAAFGCPVVAIPVGRCSEGLPIGLQLVGRRWSDRRLLAIAEALEDAGLAAYHAPTSCGPDA